MRIPKEVLVAVKAAEKKRREALLAKLPPRPKCWYMGAEVAKYHDHDANGTCIMRNHSRDEVHLSPLGGVWTRRTK